MASSAPRRRSGCFPAARRTYWSARSGCRRRRSRRPGEATGFLIARALDNEVFKLNLGRADGRYFAVNCGAGVDAAAMRRLDTRFPKTKKTFDRAPFRAVAWE